MHTADKAPEILKCEQDYSTKLDVYAFGILLYQIFSCTPDPGGVTGMSTRSEAGSADWVYQVIQKERRPKLPEISLSNPKNGALHQLLKRCWPLLEQCWAAKADSRPVSIPTACVEVERSGVT